MLATKETRAAIYPASRMYYDKVLPSVKSLMRLSDVDRIFLTIEDDTFPGYLPECVSVINGRKLADAYFTDSGPNIVRTPYVYLCMLRVIYPYAGELLKCGRILALDADTIIARDIGAEPWTMDLEGCHVAGVPEPKLSFERGKPYINAGVMIMDLERMAEDRVHERMRQAMNDRWMKWLEQDCINEFCRVKPLGPEWNTSQFTVGNEGLDGVGVKIRHWAYEQEAWENSRPYRLYTGMSWEEVELRRDRRREMEG